MAEQNQQNKKKNAKNKLVLVAMLVILICLFLVQCALKNMAGSAQEPVVEEPVVQDTVPAVVVPVDTTPVDTTPVVDTVKADTVVKPVRDPAADSIRARRKAERDSLKAIQDSIKAVEDSLKRVADSLAALEAARKADSARIADSIAALPVDSVPPTVSLVPPPGRYYEPIKLKAKCDELKCNSWISIGDTLNPVDAKKGVEYNKKGIVFFRAQDSAGNYSPWESGEYDMASDNRCGKNAYPVPVNGKEVCVDAYEYPNKADETPRDMVSQEQAASLCEAAGKRLCTIDEWQAACKGKDNTKYSYGSSYIPTRCNANTKAAQRSGRKTQCRSWWGMYDMNGNLWEWTATPSKEKATAFYVAGGSWSGNNQSRCTESSYSFYPQNQYPSVGFRCCKD